MSAPSPTILPPRWVRVAHWINACAFAVMLPSGWQIYNADPYWVPEFASWLTLGGSLPGALQWHFAAMWILIGNGAAALLLLAFSGRLRRLYLSIRPSMIVHDLGRFIQAPLSHQDGQRNIVQKISYLLVLALLTIEILSGLAIWKPVQLRMLAEGLFQGYEYARRIHFLGMCLLTLFVAGHIVLALLSPRLLLGMFGIRRARSR